MNRDELIRDKVVEWLSNETSLLEVECEAAGDGLMSLIAPILDKAEKWDRVEDTHEFKFVRHIESHLSGNQVPICTICGKTIFEIALEGKEV